MRWTRGVPSPERVVPWAVSSIDAVAIETLDPLFAAAPRIEILLIGSGAACRTYNVLMAEDRRVAAALLPARQD